jgi:methionyl-tRNA formyltransferase
MGLRPGAAVTRVVLMGKGALAVRIAGWFHDRDDFDLVCVVPVVPEPAWTDSLIGWAEQARVTHVASGDYRDLLEHDDGPFDLVFSCFYDRIVAGDFIRRCGRILNLHNGPLPRYRGVSPINWALKNGERSHGVTIHEMTPGIDDGPIVAQATYSIHPELDEVRDVYRRALRFGWLLFEETLPLLDDIEPQPQDHSLATYYSAAENERLGERRGFTRAESESGAPRHALIGHE